jgi:AcrR family transcriptional regulator/RimJ/RimL family protein N-acetyltransferase
MTTDEAQRQRIIDAAAELFAENGYSGTRVRMVAQKAGVTTHTVRRLTGGRAELLAAVMSAKITSDAAEHVAAAAGDPGAVPPLAALLDVAHEIFLEPRRSWDALELEALTRVHLDPALREVESARIETRMANMRAVVAQSRSAGGLDVDVSDEAIAHLALALSAGLAMIEPAVVRRPSVADWDALMARIGAAVAPPEMLLEPEHEARTPWRVRVDVPDRPGGLARLVRTLGALHAHTVAMQVVGVGDGERTVDLALTAPAGVSRAAILAAARSAGNEAYVGAGSPQDALDLPTRLLDGSAELVTNPSLAPLAAAELVEADRVTVEEATEGADDSTHVLRLQWTADRHVVLEREWAPFARAEQTRASALLRLSAAIAAATGDDDAVGWVEQIKDGAVWIRLAHPEDADAVAAMHMRSSERSRYQRYFAMTEWRDVQLRRLSGGHRGATLVAMNFEGDIIALGNVFPDSPGDVTAAEVALIVEDAHQGRGLGTVMLRRMIQMAERLGFTSVVAVVLADNAGMLHLLETTGLQWATTISAGVATMRAPLGVAHARQFPEGSDAPAVHRDDHPEEAS